MSSVSLLLLPALKLTSASAPCNSARTRRQIKLKMPFVVESRLGTCKEETESFQRRRNHFSPTADLILNESVSRLNSSCTSAFLIWLIISSFQLSVSFRLLKSTSILLKFQSCVLFDSRLAYFFNKQLQHFNPLIMTNPVVFFFNVSQIHWPRCFSIF